MNFVWVGVAAIVSVLLHYFSILNHPLPWNTAIIYGVVIGFLLYLFRPLLAAAWKILY